MTSPDELERAVERLTALATDLDYAAMPTKPDVVTLCGGSAADVRDDIRLILSAYREMREEPRVLAITLEGMQGEPAGMMTVGVQMTDGQKFDLIRTNGTVISHWARLPDAEARSALTTQRGG